MLNTATLLYRPSGRLANISLQSSVPVNAALRYPHSVGTLCVQENVALAPLTTIAVGGSARFFAHVVSEKELEEAVAFQQRHKLALAVLGGGSNLLVRDEGFPGLVIQVDIKGELHRSDNAHFIQFDVPAGTSWDQFVLDVCKLGLSGVECLAGIPGLTGGTPVQNVGAYGQEVGQTIQSVRAYDLLSRSFVEFTAEECRFQYRSSRFNTQEIGRYLITAVRFSLKKGARPNLTYAELLATVPQSSPTPLEIFHTVRGIRRRKGMLISADDPDSRSAGSFFKNPVVPKQHLLEIMAQGGGDEKIPHWPYPGNSPQTQQVKLAAAWLVETAGFPKGFVDGRAGISSRHSLALINRGGATFADIARLRDHIRREVAARFEIELEQEPIEIGPDTPQFQLPHRF